MVYDWDWGLDYEFSQAIYRYHAIVLGAGATLPMLVAARFLKVKTSSVMVTALLVAVLYYLAPYLRSGALGSIHTYLGVFLLVLPFAVGMFSALGVAAVVREYWPASTRGEES